MLLKLIYKLALPIQLLTVKTTGTFHYSRESVGFFDMKSSAFLLFSLLLAHN